MPRPFDSGSQCGDWDEQNCYGCERFNLAAYDRGDYANVSRCEINDAIQEAYLGDGQVSDDIARRMGWQDTDPPRYTWDCSEREAR